MLAAKLVELSARGNTHSTAENAGEKNEIPNLGLTQKQAAEAMNVSKNTVNDAVKVSKEGGPKLNEQVASGQTSVTTAAKVLRDTFCPRCTRTGPQKNCAKCQELWAKTALAARKKQPRPRKIGSEKFDFRAFDHHFGYVVRGLDDFKTAYGQCDELIECEALLRQFYKIWLAMKKRVLGLTESWRD
jgi:hypothetical protein